MNLEQRIITFPIIFILTLLFLLFGGIYPVLKEIKGNSDEFLKIQREEILFQNKLKNVEQFEGIYRSLEPDLEKADAFFVDQEVPIEFIEFLEATAKDFQVSIEISPCSPKSLRKEIWQSLAFQISLTGQIDSCLRFIEKIESAPYLIEAQNLSLRKLTQKDLRPEEAEGLAGVYVKGTMVIKVFVK